MRRAWFSLAWALLIPCSGGGRPEEAPPRASATTASATTASAPATATSVPVPSATMTPDKNPFVDLVPSLPSSFILQADTHEEVSSLIPGTRVVEHFRSYKDASGQEIFFFAWDGTPARDRGPMKVVETWKARIGSVEASVSRTSHFFGREKEVLVAHFEGPPPARRRYMIYTTRIDRAAFDAVLGAIQLSPQK